MKIQKKEKITEKTVAKITDFYGENVFNMKTMRKYLSDKAYKSLIATIREGKTLDPSIADEVAESMKNWAISKGATHFTHWFQPLTGTTAEKHDSFIHPNTDGEILLEFSGKELIQGEPDASSFPSGGLRATFEARGYTAWDPTSPAFIQEGKKCTTLCIPTAFCSYHGEALDKKTPLLRSVAALSKQVCRLAKLFGIDTKNKRAYATLGAEQEYFLIKKEFYEKRLDLIQTGRTLFGKTPGKHQQMEDHYFGAIKHKVLAFMEDLDHELWKLGIPAKTRHNEVCPGQFEIAPVYEEQNLAVDHNMILMKVLRDVAEKHGFVCILHEKPFAGVNGSGKHNNWSITGPDGKNWLTPGNNPHENAKFLTTICALMKAVDTHADLLRAAVASAGNDHRLGANEAPPAIMSIFLGDQLTDIIEQIEKGGAKSSKQSGFIEIGISSIPHLPKDITDRNRTSPFAFTGNKFEFRAVGSSQSCSTSNIVLNTIFADALSEICSQLEKATAEGGKFNDSLQIILQAIVAKHKRILFDGDNYTDKWHKEAEKRGLPNIKTTPAALEKLKEEKAVIVFTRQGVLTKVELNSRYEIYKEQYEKITHIEASVALTMVNTFILPAALEYQKNLAKTIKLVKECGSKQEGAIQLMNELSALVENLFIAKEKLKETSRGSSTQNIIAAMGVLRGNVDALEGILPDNLWPLPSYAEMLFLL